jgi:hypothetical protein
MRIGLEKNLGHGEVLSELTNARISLFKSVFFLKTLLVPFVSVHPDYGP